MPAPHSRPWNSRVKLLDLESSPPSYPASSRGARTDLFEMPNLSFGPCLLPSSHMGGTQPIPGTDSCRNYGAAQYALSTGPAHFDQGTRDIWNHEYIQLSNFGAMFITLSCSSPLLSTPISAMPDSTSGNPGHGRVKLKKKLLETSKGAVQLAAVALEVAASAAQNLPCLGSISTVLKEVVKITDEVDVCKAPWKAVKSDTGGKGHLKDRCLGKRSRRM
ncbi:hypothetical protein B0H17DRAFT_1147618 [Mycena rosella]|uniref:Uncharacterized protein n=1 Tax=Mycena rosella TaxID=1033263 RepID=A0AAD7CNU1_MYCRO|nr:hypothetical protein B0H17DRAFT_1147618 [Mycena rosella]